MDLEFYDKYILIDGYSGVGKSKLIRDILDDITLGLNSIESNLPYYVVSNKNDLATYLNRINTGEICILLCDEYIAHDVLESVKDMYCYVIAVTRQIYSDINISYRSLYKAIRNVDGITEVLPKYKFNARKTYKDFKRVITEDSGNGYDFVCAILENRFPIIPAGGKDLLAKELKNDYSDTLIIADGGGLASVCKEILKYSRRYKKKGLVLRFLLPECFEEVLLKSEFVSYSESFNPSYNNTEHWCEQVIEEVTKGLPFEYKHDKHYLSKCWTIDCTDCDKECDYCISGDKKESVLKNGPLRNLLELSKE